MPSIEVVELFQDEVQLSYEGIRRVSSSHLLKQKRKRNPDII